MGNHEGVLHSILQRRWANLASTKPLLSSPDAMLPPRIISAVEKSRPPLYSPELSALLVSPFSRTSRVFKVPDLAFPPTLPEQADASSNAAQLLGRLSKRREVNIHWRFFTSEWKKTLPPLAVTVWEKTGQDWYVTSDIGALARAGVRGTGLQGTGHWEELEKLSSPHWKPCRTRQERKNRRVQTGSSLHPTKTPSPIVLPSRWMRRRYQVLLGRTPILTFSRDAALSKGLTGMYTVSLSPNAINNSHRFPIARLAEADSVDLAWIHHAGGRVNTSSVEE
jgi:hypothetical protein